MNLIEPMFRLFSIYGEPMTWDTVHAHNVLWHERKERDWQARSLAARGSVSRGISITDAGRAYIAAMRAQTK